MTREIVLDTETTGLDPAEGHRIIEIGCIELIDHVPTEKSLQIYINPERLIPVESQKVHGISDEFIADKPVFAAVVEEFLDFIG
ncbi:MAG: DNA polymerase III subunit epsilon, partial [Alphaproteobacteria bacterium]|nr:DNA polymerase III subunit epsilon [Alphaproteobacteria bacterium]